jgi:urease accessory protein
MSHNFGLKGGVHLESKCKPGGLTYLSKQRFSPPVHLSKPYFDEDSGSLLVNLSCPTAGLLSGDHMICDIELHQSSSMVVTTPGATRSHTMRKGVAQVEQSFRLHDQSFLEFNPGTLILQASTNLKQASSIEISENAEVLYVEKILPGRIAHGESFQFKKFSNHLSIRKNKKLVLLESFSLDPSNDSVHAWRNSFLSPFYGCFYVLSSKLIKDLPNRQRIHELKSSNLLVGTSKIHGSAGWVVKILAGDPFEFSKAMKTTREFLYSDLGRTPTAFRRF